MYRNVFNCFIYIKRNGKMKENNSKLKVQVRWSKKQMDEEMEENRWKWIGKFKWQSKINVYGCRQQKEIDKQKKMNRAGGMRKLQRLSLEVDKKCLFQL